ncbi:hypothetical protein AB0O67_01720 [Streptomyces sp. NPDC086077]|uniref:hypothetical protein n=1 Tax=Streptomyces sp. NPDC086077 TaxID=3154862 RepID=UPI0034442890
MPVKATVAAMAAADVVIGLSATWYKPQGLLISNDDVTELVAQSDEKLAQVPDGDGSGWSRR